MDIDFREIMKNLREQIGALSEEVAILKATITALEKDSKEEVDGSDV